MFCNATNLTAPVGPCSGGFYCGSGSATATPGDGVDPIYNGDTCVEQPSEAINGVCPWGNAAASKIDQWVVK